MIAIFWQCRIKESSGYQGVAGQWGARAERPLVVVPSPTPASRPRVINDPSQLRDADGQTDTRSSLPAGPFTMRGPFGAGQMAVTAGVGRRGGGGGGGVRTFN